MKKPRYGVSQAIEEVTDMKARPIGSLEGSAGSHLGFTQMLNALGGYGLMDGYKVKTDSTEILILIDNGQSCCESWGYFSSDDDLTRFIGATLTEINLTDVALSKSAVEKSDWYGGDGGIQFVDFVTNKGVFQIAVYNAHNGYYGHGIVVAIGNEVFHEDTL